MNTESAFSNLTLFDIDGTLLRSVSGRSAADHSATKTPAANHQAAGTQAASHPAAFSEGFRKVYGVDTDIEVIKHSGMTDQQVIIEVLKKNGLQESEILPKLDRKSVV
mgnify:CR=1 FL=1